MGAAEAHVGAEPSILDELTLGFSRALLFEMKRVHKDRSDTVPLRDGSPSRPDRRRVIEAIGRYLDMVKSLH